MTLGHSLARQLECPGLSARFLLAKHSLAKLSKSLCCQLGTAREFSFFCPWLIGKALFLQLGAQDHQCLKYIKSRDIQSLSEQAAGVGSFQTDSFQLVGRCC